MVDIIDPTGGEVDSRKRSWCRCCGLDVTHPKFGGKVIVANAAGHKDKDEILFCAECSRKEEAQEIYRELMAIEKKRIIRPVIAPDIVNVGIDK